jgi:hypothetical protein
MEKLSIKSFTSFSGDQEIDQYRILSGIKEYSENFRKKRLYPALSELIDLAALLENILNHKKGLSKSFPKNVIGFDIENKKIILEDAEVTDENIKIVFDLIEWSVPVIRRTIEEGIALYEFVEKNINIDQVGILPLYKNEGYLIIPDNLIEKFLIHRFHFALYDGDKEKFRTIKTIFIEVVEKGLVNTPEYLKQKLIEKYRDFPNPATFFCETDLDLPFSETLFPVVKRKLLSRIS